MLRIQFCIHNTDFGRMQLFVATVPDVNRASVFLFPPSNSRHRHDRWPLVTFPLPRRSQKPSSIRGALRSVGPDSPKPDYAQLDSVPLNRIVYSLFRAKLAQALGRDSSMEGYDAIVDLTRRLNALGSPRTTQITTRAILNSLFPSWLPGAFKIMFSGPFPDFSCRLNAFATWATCQWLMGECEVFDVEVDGGTIGRGHGVLVKRCRYLEETGCASVCINSCKVPTQEFFTKDMGLPLTLTPNYDEYSCQFSFGLTPKEPAEDSAFTTSCFVQCPVANAQQRQRSESDDACWQILP